MLWSEWRGTRLDTDATSKVLLDHFRKHCENARLLGCAEEEFLVLSIPLKAGFEGYFDADLVRLTLMQGHLHIYVFRMELMNVDLKSLSFPHSVAWCELHSVVWCNASAYLRPFSFYRAKSEPSRTC